MYQSRHKRLELHYCPGPAAAAWPAERRPAVSAISPFNLFEYVTHLKRKAGPTAFRNDSSGVAHLGDSKAS